MRHIYIEMKINVKYFIYNLSITNNNMPKRNSIKACFINNALSLLCSRNIYVSYLQFMNVVLYSELIRESFRASALVVANKVLSFFQRNKILLFF
jgi:hypothetical protein